MANAVLFHWGQLGDRLPEVRQVENGVVAESAGASWFTADHPLLNALGVDEPTVRQVEDEDGPVASRPSLRRYASRPVVITTASRNARPRRSCNQSR